jgi:DNA-binding CsgD family transcriptional regulator
LLERVAHAECVRSQPFHLTRTENPRLAVTHWKVTATLPAKRFPLAYFVTRHLQAASPTPSRLIHATTEDFLARGEGMAHARAVRDRVSAQRTRPLRRRARRRARVELEAAGEHARNRTVDTLGDLTPQEAQTSGLVVQGHSNRGIVAQLFISPSRVEYHLHKVFRKLGVKSRTQLARRLS